MNAWACERTFLPHKLGTRINEFLLGRVPGYVYIFEVIMFPWSSCLHKRAITSQYFFYFPIFFLLPIFKLSKDGKTETVRHWFDGHALIHRFNIDNGQITYFNKFLRSEVYMKNKKYDRNCLSEGVLKLEIFMKKLLAYS